jgi:hypothetical protein
MMKKIHQILLLNGTEIRNGNIYFRICCFREGKLCNVHSASIIISFQFVDGMNQNL